MNIIKFPLTKTEDAFGKAIYELPHGVVLGHDGENLTTEIQIMMDELKSSAVYTLEFSHADGIVMKKHDSYLSAEIGAEILSTGDIQAQLSWSWKEKRDGEEKTLTDKSKVARWRVLDSVELSDALEQKHPEILAQILTDIEDLKQYGGGGGSGRPGEDGFSPEIAVEEVEGGYQLTITNKDAEPTIMTIYHGKDGEDGDDGFSPTIETAETDNGYEMKITDKTHTETVLVKHGKNGDDGFSPTVEMYATDTGIMIKTTDKEGVHEKEVLHGKDGETPVKGKDYDDGFSPEVTAEETDTCVKITVTHKEADPTVVEVKHGKNGDDYILTDTDKQDIATYVYGMIEDGDNLTY